MSDALDPQLPGNSNYSDSNSDGLVENDDEFNPHVVFSDISNSEGEYDLDENDEDDLVFNVRKRPRGRTAPRERELPPEVDKLLTEAALAYSNQDAETALQLTEEALSLDSTARKGYLLMAAILEDMGEFERVLAARLTAVHLDKRNYDEWIYCAQLSEELGQQNQAMVLYTQALRVDNRDVDIQLKIVELLRQVGEYSKAIRNAMRIRNELFYLIHDTTKKSNLIMDLAICLKFQGRTDEAIRIYEDILEQNIRYDEKIAEGNESNNDFDSGSDFDSDYRERDKRAGGGGDDGENDDSGKKPRRNRRDKPEIPFLFNELNNLVELYYYEKEYLKALNTVKDVSRYLNGRKDETFWKEFNNDAEFDERRKKISPKLKALSKYIDDDSKYELPIDIRYWLILCRLELDKNSVEIMNQVEILQTFEAIHYSDLYFLIGEALYGHAYYEKALELFISLDSYEEFRDINLTIQIAKCLYQLKRFGEAEDKYLEVLNVQSNNIETLVALAELYGSTNRIDEARDLIAKVNMLRSTDRQEADKDKDKDKDRDKQKQRPTDVVVEGTDEEAYVPPDFIRNKRSEGHRRPKHKRLTISEKIRKERDDEELTTERFRQLKRYNEGRLSNNPAAISEWLRNSAGLISSFKSCKKFFLSDKSRMFAGYNNKKKNKGTTIDERIELLANKIKEQELDDDDEDEDESNNNNSITKFRNVDFDTWLDAFMEAALLKAKMNDPDGSFEILDIARSANVFHLDEKRNDIIVLVYISCAYMCNEYKVANEFVRQYMNLHQLYNDLYRLYGAIFPSGSVAMDLYNGPSNQKFFLRQLKAFDSLIKNTEVRGAAKIYDKSVELTEDNPLILTLYAHIMLLGRSYVPSLIYLTRAHTIKPKDPMILLTLAVIHIHRAIQRQTTNRHLQIVQGLSYLVEYYDIRSAMGPHEEQEANYNLARAFHMVGLMSFATEYYNRVLNISTNINPQYDLRAEAAYNLHLIYTVSGNPQLSRSIIDTYLVV